MGSEGAVPALTQQDEKGKHLAGQNRPVVAQRTASTRPSHMAALASIASVSPVAGT